MPVSESDKAKMRRLGEDLKRFESNDRGTPEFRARWIAWANRRRAEIGMPPLKDEDEDPPEEEFYRKARARGMVRSPRRDP